MSIIKVKGGAPAEKAEAMTAQLIEDAGYDLLEISYERMGEAMNLTYYIDKRGGVTIDDCEAVTELLNPILDESPVTNRAYNLVVSSPGVDRPFEQPRDFLRYLDREVEVKLRSPLPGGVTEVTGWLRAYKDGELTLTEEPDGDVEGEDAMVFPADSYALVKQALRF